MTEVRDAVLARPKAKSPIGRVYRGKGDHLMRTAALALRRSTSQVGLLSTVGAVTLVLTALVVGLIGYLDFSATINARAFVSVAAPTAKSLQVETKLAADSATQSTAAGKLFAQEFAGTPVDISRTRTSTKRAATPGPDP